MRLAIKDGDVEQALELARSAYALRPQAPWVLTNLFQLEVKLQQWNKALETLNLAVKRKAIDAEQGQRHRAALLIERSREREAADKLSEALADARKAAELAPTLAPASAAAIRLFGLDGKHRRAVKLAQKVWGLNPHAEVGTAYLAIREDEEPLDQFSRVEQLTDTNPDHPESHMLLAQAALRAQLWGQARNYMQKVIDADPAPNARVCRLMAELERAEHGNMMAAQHWLERASIAPPAPAWVCGDCGATADGWNAQCGHCGAFDRLDWRRPPRVMPLSVPETALTLTELRTPEATEPVITDVEVDTIAPAPPDVAAAEPDDGAEPSDGEPVSAEELETPEPAAEPKGLEVEPKVAGNGQNGATPPGREAAP